MVTVGKAVRDTKTQMWIEPSQDPLTIKGAVYVTSADTGSCGFRTGRGHFQLNYKYLSLVMDQQRGFHFNPESNPCPKSPKFTESLCRRHSDV